MDIIGISGLLVGVVGIGIGIHQNRQKAHIERLASLQAWEVYQSAYQALGWLSDVFREDDPQKKQMLLIEARARADSHYIKAINNLFSHQSKVTPALVDKWIKEGRIKEESRKDFVRHIGEKD